MTPELHPDFLRIPLAHRALHDVSEGRPENSRSAVRAAIKAGYGIEIDIQRSADDCAMVFHDYTLERLAKAEGVIRDRTAADLAKIELRGSQEGIPTLPDVLALVQGQVPILIEIKDQDGSMGPSIGPLEKSVAEAISTYKGPVAVMSFNPHSVAEMARRAPSVARGIVTSAYEVSDESLPEDVRVRLREIPDYERTESCFISHDRADLPRARVLALKKQGARILCWTIKSPKEEAAAREIAENITFEQYLAPFPA
ncbi:MAG: glycerophosphodiester phosphodiesterase family protein [Roseobacter sp.]